MMFKKCTCTVVSWKSPSPTPTPHFAQYFGLKWGGSFLLDISSYSISITCTQCIMRGSWLCSGSFVSFMAFREGTCIIVKAVLAVILAVSRVGPTKASLIFCLHFHTAHSCLSVIHKMVTSLIPNIIQDSPSNNSPLKNAMCSYNSRLWLAATIHTVQEFIGMGGPFLSSFKGALSLLGPPVLAKKISLYR